MKSDKERLQKKYDLADVSVMWLMTYGQRYLFIYPKYIGVILIWALFFQVHHLRGKAMKVNFNIPKKFYDMDGDFDE
ncbi:MAG: hypothetical protein FWF59_12150 [Turicibacter sp.]|nr:hypothetical protein [Turicibacter sp.]